MTYRDELEAAHARIRVLEAAHTGTGMRVVARSRSFGRAGALLARRYWLLTGALGISAAYEAVAATLDSYVTADGTCDVATDCAVSFHLPYGGGEGNGDGGDVMFALPGETVFRTTTLGLSASPTGSFPGRALAGLAPLPITLRYTNVFGITRTTEVRFDVRQARTRRVMQHLFDGQAWAHYSKRNRDREDRYVVRFDSASTDCTIVHYSFDSDALDHVVPEGSDHVLTPRLPDKVAVRFDFCDGYVTPTQHSRADAEQADPF